MDEKKATEFRTRLLEDDSFRANFAKSPREALHSIGVEVPASAELPSISKDQLDQRVATLKDKVSTDMLDQLLAGSSDGVMSDEQLEAVAGGAGSEVYRISAFGTLDW